jgi:hypothetical protein
LVVSGDGGDVDELQNGEGSLVASTESSSSSWNAEEKPLEELHAPACFGWCYWRQITARWSKWRASA